MHCGYFTLPPWSIWGQRFQLVAFPLFGLIFAILHHLLGNYLSGKPISYVVSYGQWAFPSQPLVNALGNVLSQVVKWLLVNTIAVAFTQYFWSAAKDYDNWRKLDAPLAAANGNPFTIAALPTWCRFRGLAFTALTMMSMISIPIFAPGSIRVVNTSGLMRPCTVEIPNASLADLAKIPSPLTEPFTAPADKANTQTTALITRVIVGGSYLPIPNPCGVCAYQVNFTGVSLKCSSDINGTYDFSTNLPPSHQGNLPILNGTFPRYGRSYSLRVATRDGVISRMNPPVAVSCDAFRADYHVRVRHDTLSSQIDILGVTPDFLLSPRDFNSSDIALGGLALAVGNAFNGTVIFDPVYYGFAGAPLSVAYSPLLRWVRTGGGVLTWSDLTTSLPELMQNVSLSLLSGQFPPKNQTYMEKVQTECSMTMLAYAYSYNRLVAIYAPPWAVAAIFLFLGFWFISRNGEEHVLDFSHLVGHLHLGPYSQVSSPEDLSSHDGQIGLQLLGNGDNPTHYPTQSPIDDHEVSQTGHV